MIYLSQLVETQFSMWTVKRSEPYRIWESPQKKFSTRHILGIYGTRQDAIYD